MGNGGRCSQHKRGRPLATSPAGPSWCQVAGGERVRDFLSGGGRGAGGGGVVDQLHIAVNVQLFLGVVTCCLVDFLSAFSICISTFSVTCISLPQLTVNYAQLPYSDVH